MNTDILKKEVCTGVFGECQKAVFKLLKKKIEHAVTITTNILLMY